MTVTFETKIWENDWKYVLEGDYLKQVIDRCNFSFDKKVLFINNVKNKEKVNFAALQKKELGIIDEFYFVEEFANEALSFFNIEKESFKGGYYYSIAELVSIYLCETDYLLHFSSDSLMKNPNSEWISRSLPLLEEENSIVVANPTWNSKFEEAKSESFDEIDGFFLGEGFSDQCYLIKTSVFRDQIYHYKHPSSERYPKYGGELFEKRVDSFMKVNNLHRITCKTSSYKSKNWSTNIFLKKSKKLRSLYVDWRLRKYLEP